jgi:hypothetical protein
MNTNKEDRPPYIQAVIVIISMLMIMWHVIVPRSLHIDGYFGYPLVINGFLVGWCFNGILRYIKNNN